MAFEGCGNGCNHQHGFDRRGKVNRPHRLQNSICWQKMSHCLVTFTLTCDKKSSGAGTNNARLAGLLRLADFYLENLSEWLWRGRLWKTCLLTSNTAADRKAIGCLLRQRSQYLVYGPNRTRCFGPREIRLHQVIGTFLVGHQILPLHEWMTWRPSLYGKGSADYQSHV